MSQISSQFTSKDILLKDLNRLMTSLVAETFSPLETNVTKSGIVVTSAIYQLVGKLCFVIIHYMPSPNTIAFGAGATIKLPVTPARNAGYTYLYKTNNFEVFDATSETAIGTAVVDTQNKQIKLPTLLATSDEVVISGYYWIN